MPDDSTIFMLCNPTLCDGGVHKNSGSVAPNIRFGTYRNLSMTLLEVYV